MIYYLFWWLCIITGYPFNLILFKRKTFYEDKSVQSLRVKGGALIISNHCHFYDYVLNMFALAPRRLHVVAAEMAFCNPWIRFGMRFFGGIEANRQTKSMRFMDVAAEKIREGKLVQIFPEARITTDGSLQPFKHSYIVIAYRAGAPIIPIITDGNYGFFKRTHIMVGKPIYVSDYIKSDRRTPTREELTAFNEMVYAKVAELRNQLEELKRQPKNSKKNTKKEDAQ
ncbi:MAG: 1-acyl-sn-glycerol-3-phosphate acyltransferase [Clostridia bacterium]|nr:1-acyl-sn-glycerol-3-phosphate acyltransferase [Clostridia bacterium]